MIASPVDQVSLWDGHLWEAIDRLHHLATTGSEHRCTVDQVRRRVLRHDAARATPTDSPK